MEFMSKIWLTNALLTVLTVCIIIVLGKTPPSWIVWWFAITVLFPVAIAGVYGVITLWIK